MPQRDLLILGGYGTFGRLIAEQLAATPDARVILAGRRPEQARPLAESLGTDVRQCDAGDPVSLRRAVEGVWLVVNASGPFRAGDYAIPEAAIDAGSHYIDLADGREYVCDVVRLDAAARARGVFVCAGASTTPAITSALVEHARKDQGAIRSIRIALNAGNKNRAGVSTIATILSYVGRPVEVWRGGAWRTERGWSGGERVEFPPPVGRRRVQLCDVPDLTLFPERFAAETVTFKAGVELTVLNYAIGALGAVRRVRPSANLPALARPLVAMSRLFKPFGTLHGGCAAWVEDVAGRQRTVALVAHENGPRIPGSPAVLLARKLLAGRIDAVGAFPCLGFLGLAEFAEFLAPYRIDVVEGDDGTWGEPLRAKLATGQ